MHFALINQFPVCVSFHLLFKHFLPNGSHKLANNTYYLLPKESLDSFVPLAAVDY